MKNLVSNGEDGIPLTAPYAVSAGGGFLIGGTGGLFAVAVDDAANGAPVVGMLEGIFDLTCLGTDTAAGPGVLIYWDDTNKRCTTTSTSNTKIGCTTQAKTNGPTTVRVKLNNTV
jgi:predicted RecA/RadA family phage recombinase